VVIFLLWTTSCIYIICKILERFIPGYYKHRLYSVDPSFIQHSISPVLFAMCISYGCSCVINVHIIYVNNIHNQTIYVFRNDVGNYEKVSSVLLPNLTSFHHTTMIALLREVQRQKTQQQVDKDDNIPESFLRNKLPSYTRTLTNRTIDPPSTLQDMPTVLPISRPILPPMRWKRYYPCLHLLHLRMSRNIQRSVSSIIYLSCHSLIHLYHNTTTP